MEAVCEQVHGGGEEEEEEEEGEEAMLWSIQEAVERQTQQIGASTCGATAVVDVLKALGVDVAPEDADRCVQTRLRRPESPLPDYLLSRSQAGKCPGERAAGHLLKYCTPKYIIKVLVLYLSVSMLRNTLASFKQCESISKCGTATPPFSFLYNLYFYFFLKAQ